LGGRPPHNQTEKEILGRQSLPKPHYRVTRAITQVTWKKKSVYSDSSSIAIVAGGVYVFRSQSAQVIRP
jgi:hypothetical protein